ncbi:hypothetical protein J3Q64DRAFT_1818541 [Phycomyces blakesleeanus]|uniref:Uncharacterized protein n=1 Tax=Phycomyces blakesleeanus TaxID=4837 RepID=A0ABR3BAB8_PHYBL
MTTKVILDLVSQFKADNEKAFCILMSAVKGLTEKVESLQQDNFNLKADLNALRKEISYSKPNFINDSIDDRLAVHKEYGIFTGMDFPVRFQFEPKKPDGQKMKFSWAIYHQLIKDVLGPASSKLLDSGIEACTKSVKDGRLICVVKEIVCKEHDIPLSTMWGALSAEAQNSAILHLEEMSSPHLPLRVCISNWGAKLLLSKYWNYEPRTAKKVYSETNASTTSPNEEPISVYNTTSYLPQYPHISNDVDVYMEVMQHNFDQGEHPLNYPANDLLEHVQKKKRENPLVTYSGKFHWVFKLYCTKPVAFETEYDLPHPIAAPTRKQRSDKGKKRGANKCIQA